MAATTGTMTPAVMRKALQSFIAAWNDHDVDAVIAMVADDVQWENPANPKPVTGRTQAAKDVEATFTAFPDLHFPKEDFHAYSTDDPSVGFTTWTVTGTMTGPLSGLEPTGRHVRLGGVCAYRFRDGLIAEHRIVFDSLDFVQQLGLIPREEDFSYKAMVQVQRLATKTRRALHV